MSNPDFGTLYKIPCKEDKPFDSRVQVRVHKTTKQQLEQLAELQGEGVGATDMVRKAIYKYIEDNKHLLSA